MQDEKPTAAESGTLPIDRLSLFLPGDEEWLERHCNGTSHAQSDQAVYRDMERQAEKRADSIAVRCAGNELNYRQLNENANALAHYLQARGVTANSRVIVCIEPSFDIVIALFAIFKAGATYVPLNPSHPEFRLRAIIDDTRPTLTLTHACHRELFPGASDRLVCLDRDSAAIARCATHNLITSVAADDNATVYYTSGTTGKPKGVMASHANLRHIIDVTQRKYGLTSTDVMPAVAAFTFSISAFELLSPLAAGGTLLLLEREQVLDAGYMSDVLKSVTIAHIGPSLLRNIVRYIQSSSEDPADFSRLRHLSSGGDTIPPQLLRDMQRHFPNAELYVIYGCSEISLMGCTHEVRRHDRIERTFVGKPFPNVGMLILDDDDNTVPAGAVGDVCFSGNGLTAGYLNRPELTEEQFFIRDGRRWYRTGDRGRLNDEGLLELLGRRDFQVQLRGMRVEPGEIEHHLRQAPGVRDGVVSQVRIAGERMALVAWYVCDPAATVTEQALRQHLLQRLPDYMVPAFYRPLDAMPLNHNLKLDRAALPNFTMVANDALIEPRTPSERKLVDIWRRVLQQPGIGRGDNFFLLGGDSLLAMEMLLLVQMEMDIKLDGMDVLRESLQVLGAICDRQLAVRRGDTPAPPRVVDPARRQIPAIESFFFGDDDSLYGVYHPPAAGDADRALLICPALGHENSRTHFLLKSLAGRLANSGYGVLRFDYFGTGDSFGDSEHGSLQRWRADILAACQELVRRSDVTNPAVLGVRAGGNLALQALEHGSVTARFCWDPIVDGHDHLRRLSAMHARRVRRLIYLRHFRRPTFSTHGRELLGITYSDQTIDELQNLKLDSGSFDRDNTFCLLSRQFHETSFDDASTEKIDVFCDWYSVPLIGTAIGANSIVQRLEERIMRTVP